ncbi:MAG: lyase family protein, partial [Phycisphaerales bacterium JB059]
MSTPIWATSEGVETRDEAMSRFMAGEDVRLDRELIGHDVTATLAHVRGLERIGLMGAEESRAIERALDELRELIGRGDFVLDERFEDGHSAIEAFLVERLGETGKRVHLGRSRNDQVLVATR